MSDVKEVQCPCCGHLFEVDIQDDITNALEYQEPPYDWTELD